MSRRVVIVISIIVVLSILIAIGLFFVTSLNKEQSAQPAPDSTSNTGLTSNDNNVDPLADTDNDGLNNTQEALWGTNPNNPDTDGDQYKDGDEVANCHNPLVPAPKDKLANCSPGDTNNPASSVATAGTSDPFFPTPVKKIGGDINLTQAYATALKDSDKSPVTFSQFIANQPIITDLPTVNDKAIKTAPESVGNVSQYMITAGNLDSITDKQRLSIAIKDFLESRNPYGFTTLAESVDALQSRLKVVAVPPSALEYEKTLLAYTEILSATLRQIADYQNDQVKALVAIRQLDAIDRQYYPQIVQARESLLNPTN
ncbi:MAG: hypothetical protein ABIP54_02510 [Candidatus Andersenbacteria bacterium]